MLEDKEKEILNCLVDAWNKFIQLDRQHPGEHNDFADGINKCQYVLGMRIARRTVPDVFPIKNK